MISSKRTKRRESVPRRQKHARTKSCVSPGSLIQSPDDSKAIIMGKRISNNGGLNLSLDFDEIKRFVIGYL